MIYQITIRWVKTQPTDAKIAEVEKQLASVGDWMRLNVYSWFIHTAKDSITVYNSLLQIFNAEDSIVIVEVGPSLPAGWAPKWVWDWFQQRQQGQDILANILNPPSPFSPPYKL